MYIQVNVNGVEYHATVIGDDIFVRPLGKFHHTHRGVVSEVGFDGTTRDRNSEGNKNQLKHYVRKLVAERR